MPNKLTTGQKYDTATLTLAGWTSPDTERYSCWDYFRDGVYLGPDRYDVEPLFDIAADGDSSTTYTLEMRDDASRETRTITATTLDDAREQADAETEEWIEGGEWGRAGASVRASWTLTDEAGDEVADGAVTVEIEPDHDALIRDAGGDPDCDHAWSSEGEGGCAENPGVWSTGGTSIVTAEHCTRCGLHRVTKHTGSQRNPGEHDTVTYSQPNDYDGSDD